MEPTTFSALKAMEQLGYLTRRQMPDNRKNVYVFLTPRGKALKAKLVPLAEDVNRIAVTGLSAADIARNSRHTAKPSLSGTALPIASYVSWSDTSITAAGATSRAAGTDTP